MEKIRALALCLVPYSLRIHPAAELGVVLWEIVGSLPGGASALQRLGVCLRVMDAQLKQNRGA